MFSLSVATLLWARTRSKPATVSPSHPPLFSSSSPPLLLFSSSSSFSIYFFVLILLFSSSSSLLLFLTLSETNQPGRNPLTPAGLINSFSFSPPYSSFLFPIFPFFLLPYLSRFSLPFLLPFSPFLLPYLIIFSSSPFLLSSFHISCLCPLYLLYPTVSHF